MRPTLYCIDSCSLIEAWNQHYPPVIFAKLWRDLEALIQSGAAIACDEVRKELKRKDDGVFSWATNQDGLFVPMDSDQQRYVVEVMTNFPKLVKTTKGRSAGDPFVIALARSMGADIVTEESEGNDNRPKIPDACDPWGIRCLKFRELIREQGWRY
jgi:phosphomannomutase